MKYFALMLLAISASAYSSNIIIDPEGVDMGIYQKDLQDCENIAGQVDNKGGAGAVRGAVVGGAIGAARGNSKQAKKDAGVGAVVGGASGRSATQAEKTKVIKTCLTNKGYTVLN